MVLGFLISRLILLFWKIINKGMFICHVFYCDNGTVKCVLLSYLILINLLSDEFQNRRKILSQFILF